MYYSLSIGLMDTFARFEPTYYPSQLPLAITKQEREARGYSLEQSDDRYEAWSLGHLMIGPPLDKDDLAALIDHVEDSGNDVVTVSVSGHPDEELWLEFSPATRSPKDESRWGGSRSPREPKPLFGISLSPQQALTLAAALRAAAQFDKEVPAEEW